MEPPMALLISKLIQQHCLVWRCLNAAVSLSLKRRHPDSIADAFQANCANDFRFASQLGD